MGLPVVVCIGSAGVCGDSLGPLVGEILINHYRTRAFVYGTTTSPVNGVNFEHFVKHVKKAHEDSLIIAVDACVGHKDDVGRIKITKGGLEAGSALNKNLTRIGDIGILGIVSEKQKDNLFALMNVPYEFVEEMSKSVACKVQGLLDKWHNFGYKS